MAPTNNKHVVRAGILQRPRENCGGVLESAHQEELALHIAHHCLQPRRVELPVLAQHLSKEAAQVGSGSGSGSELGSGLGLGPGPGPGPGPGLALRLGLVLGLALLVTTYY